MADVSQLRVEVVYALPQEQVIHELHVEPGTTVEEAIRLSGVLEAHSQIDLDNANKVGVFGKLAKLDQVLRDGDRVEIYRPLIADPKEVRRKRAEAGKVMTKGAAAKAQDDSEA